MALTVTYDGNLLKVGNTLNNTDLFFSVFIMGTWPGSPLDPDADNYSYVADAAVSSLGFNVGAVSIPFTSGKIGQSKSKSIPITVNKLALEEFFTDNAEAKKYAWLQGHLKLEGFSGTASATKWSEVENYALDSFKFKIKARQHKTLKEAQEKKNPLGFDVASIVVNFGTGEFIAKFAICAGGGPGGNFPLGFEIDDGEDGDSDNPWSGNKKYGKGAIVSHSGKTYESIKDCYHELDPSDPGRDVDGDGQPGTQYCNKGINPTQHPQATNWWIERPEFATIQGKVTCTIVSTEFGSGTSHDVGGNFLVKVPESFRDYIGTDDQADDWKIEPFKYESERHKSKCADNAGQTSIHRGKNGVGYFCMRLMPFTEAEGGDASRGMLFREATATDNKHEVFEWKRWWHWGKAKPTMQGGCANCWDRELESIKIFLVEKGYTALRNGGFPYISGVPVPVNLSFNSGDGTDGTQGFVTAYEVRARSVQKQMVMGDAVTTNLFDVNVPLTPKAVDNKVTALLYDDGGEDNAGKGNKTFTERIVKWYGDDVRNKSWDMNTFSSVTKTQTVEMVNVWEQTVVSSLKQIGPNGKMEAEITGTDLQLEHHFLRMYETASSNMGFNIGNRYFRFNTVINTKMDRKFDDESTASAGAGDGGRYEKSPLTIQSNIQVKRLFEWVSSWGSGEMPNKDNLEDYEDNGKISKAETKRAEAQSKVFGAELEILRDRFDRREITAAYYYNERARILAAQKPYKLIMAKRRFWDDTLRVKLPDIKNGVYDINDMSFNYAVDLPNNFKITMTSDSSGNLGGQVDWKVELGEGKCLGMTINTEGKAALSYNYEKKGAVFGNGPTGFISNLKVQAGLAYNHEEATEVTKFASSKDDVVANQKGKGKVANEWLKGIPIVPTWGTSFDMLEHLKISINNDGLKAGFNYTAKRTAYSKDMKAAGKGEKLSEMSFQLSAGIAPRYQGIKKQVYNTEVFEVIDEFTWSPELRFNISYTRNLGYWGDILGTARLNVKAQGGFGGVNSGGVTGWQFGFSAAVGVQFEMRNVSYLGDLLGIGMLDWDIWPTFGFQLGFYHGEVESGFGNTWKGSASSIGFGLISWTFGRRDKIEEIVRKRKYSFFGNITPAFLNIGTRETDEDYIMRMIPELVNALAGQAIHEVAKDWAIEAKKVSGSCLNLQAHYFPGEKYTYPDEMSCGPTTELEGPEYVNDVIELLDRWTQYILNLPIKNPRTYSNFTGKDKVNHKGSPGPLIIDGVKIKSLAMARMYNLVASKKNVKVSEAVIELIRFNGYKSNWEQWAAFPTTYMCDDIKSSIQEFLTVAQRYSSRSNRSFRGWRNRGYALGDIAKARGPSKSYLFNIESEYWDYNFDIEDCGEAKWPSIKTEGGAFNQSLKPVADKHKGALGKYMQDWSMDKYYEIAYDYILSRLVSTSSAWDVEELNVGPRGVKPPKVAYSENLQGTLKPNGDKTSLEGDGYMYAHCILNPNPQVSMHKKGSGYAASMHPNGEGVAGPWIKKGETWTREDRPYICFQFENRNGHTVGYWCERYPLTKEGGFDKVQAARKMKNRWRNSMSSAESEDWEDLDSKEIGRCFTCLELKPSVMNEDIEVMPGGIGTLLTFGPDQDHPKMRKYCWYQGDAFVKGAWEFYKNLTAHVALNGGAVSDEGKRVWYHEGGKNLNVQGYDTNKFPHATTSYQLTKANYLDFHHFIKQSEMYSLLGYALSDRDIQDPEATIKFKKIACKGPYPNTLKGEEFNRFPFGLEAVDGDGLPIGQYQDCGMSERDNGEGGNFYGIPLNEHVVGLLKKKLPVEWGGSSFTESADSYAWILEHVRFNGPSISARMVTSLHILSDPLLKMTQDTDYASLPFLTTTKELSDLEVRASTTAFLARQTHLTALEAVSDPQKLGNGQGQYSSYVINSSLFSQYVNVNMDPYSSSFELAHDANTVWNIAKKYAVPTNEISLQELGEDLPIFVKAATRLNSLYERVGSTIEAVTKEQAKKKDQTQWKTSLDKDATSQMDKAVKTEFADSIRKFLHAYIQLDLNASESIMRHALIPLKNLILNRTFQTVLGGQGKYWSGSTAGKLGNGPTCAGKGRPYWSETSRILGARPAAGPNWWHSFISSRQGLGLNGLYLWSYRDAEDVQGVAFGLGVKTLKWGTNPGGGAAGEGGEALYTLPFGAPFAPGPIPPMTSVEPAQYYDRPPNWKPTGSSFSAFGKLINSLRSWPFEGVTTMDLFAGGLNFWSGPGTRIYYGTKTLFRDGVPISDNNTGRVNCKGEGRSYAKIQAIMDIKAIMGLYIGRPATQEISNYRAERSWSPTVNYHTGSVIVHNGQCYRAGSRSGPSHTGYAVYSSTTPDATMSTPYWIMIDCIPSTETTESAVHNHSVFDSYIYKLLFYPKRKMTGRSNNANYFWENIPTSKNGSVSFCNKLAAKYFNINSDMAALGFDNYLYSSMLQRMNRLMGKKPGDLSMMGLLQLNPQWQISIKGADGNYTFEFKTNVTSAEYNNFLKFWEKVSPF